MKAAQEAYRKASLEREISALHVAHSLFKANRKTVVSAGDVLSRFERLEYLWATAIEFGWKIGREKVRERRKNERIECELREREEKEREEREKKERRPSSYREVQRIRGYSEDLSYNKN